VGLERSGFGLIELTDGRRFALSTDKFHGGDRR